MESMLGSAQLVEVLGVMVPILGILMPVAIVAIVLHHRHRRSVEVLATVRYLAEKGLPVPAGLLQSTDPYRQPADPRDRLLTVFSTLGAGIGLMVFFYLWTPMRGFWGIGALVAIVGLAQLIALWLTRKRAHDDAGDAAG